MEHCLNPLFGGSAFRTQVKRDLLHEARVLIPFLAGLLFGLGLPGGKVDAGGLNPLFGGSAFRTKSAGNDIYEESLNPLFGGSAFRTGAQGGQVCFSGS